MQKIQLLLIAGVLAILSTLLIADFLFAQSELPPPMPEEPAQSPIDGGLGILAAAGGVYAIKKLKDRKR